MSQHPFRLVRWVVLLACICVVQMPHHAEAFSGTGDGLSAETAFIITTCDQLQEMNNELELYYKLGNNIDCSATASWNPNASEWVDGVVGGTRIADPYTGVINNGYYGFDPIGQESAHNAGVGFTGTLDGQGYSISNLWIFRKEDDYNGLIGYASGATIKNLTLVAPRIVGSSDTGGILGYGTGVTLENLTNQNGMIRAYLAYYGGGIAGQISDSMELDRLTVSGGTVHGSGNVIGGLVGWIYDSAVSSSTSSANIDGGEYIGGAFGSVYNVQVQDIAVTGSVESNASEDVYISGFSKNSRYVGGFAGRIAASTIQRVTATGDVVAGGVYAGGFAGVIEESSVITYATTSGDVLGYGLGGGFAGLISSSTIYDAIARGDVELTNADAGGFAGQTNCSSVFLRVAAYGNVTAVGSYVGGFVGSDGCEGPGSAFTQAAAHGNVTSSGEYVGGFIGFSGQSTITDAYAGGSVTGGEYVGGFGGYVAASGVTRTYARGVVVGGDGATRVGGYGGEVINTENAWSFTNSTVSGQSSVCGVGECVGVGPLTTSEARSIQTYVDANWDFGEVWEMDADISGYPHFQWERFGMIFAGSGTSQDPYQVTECFTAQSSGYYQLQQDIDDVASICIDIQADGVRIDGNGHSIMGNGETSSTGIYTEGYDDVRISNITIGLFSDGIRLYDVQGDSSITSVTIATSRDNGIELRGVNGVTISDATILNSTDDGISVRMYFGDFDNEIQNNNILIEDMVIQDTGEFGINIEYAESIRIHNNEISNTDDDGIAIYLVEGVEIHDNQFTNINSDGMYFEQAINVEILRNTITGAAADAIDIDGVGEGYYNASFIITHNVFTDIGDVGFEIDELQGVTIAHNTLEVADDGINAGDSEDIEFTNNTITPTNRIVYQLPSVSTQSVPLDIGDAEVQLSAVFDTLSYTLPFTFNFQGRDITAIAANTNGAIELLENAETCEMCGSGGDYTQNLYSDTIFASFDLIDVSGVGDYVAIFNQNDESVIVEWKGTTFADSNSVEHPVHFQVELFPNGTVEWNFMQMNFEGYNGSMFTGAYDVVANRVYRAGSAIQAVSSYRADMSGNTSYTPVTLFDPITGIDLFRVSNMVITGNIIHAERWVNTSEVQNITFNDSDSGNTYLLTNGAGAWTQFDIVDTDGNGYAESGTDRPFSNATLGSQYWVGGDADAYPRVIASTSTPPVPVVVTVASMSSGGFQSGVSSVLFNRPQATSTAVTAGVPAVPNRTPVTTTRDLQRFLNTNGFPVALTGPGSLNNETGIFGTRTRQALMRFQKANGIVPALGIFGPITKAFINSSTATSVPVGSSTSVSIPATPSPDDELNLTVGSTGAAVTQLQEFLISAGFPIADGATGRFGQQTRRALIAYQNANKIIPATGTFGPLTRAHMKNTQVAELWW